PAHGFGGSAALRQEEDAPAPGVEPAYLVLVVHARPRAEPPANIGVVQRPLEHLERFWTGVHPRAVLVPFEHVAHQASLRARSHAPDVLLDRAFYAKAPVQHRIVHHVLFVRHGTGERLPRHDVRLGRLTGELSGVHRELRQIPAEGRGGGGDTLPCGGVKVHLELPREDLAPHEEELEGLSPFRATQRADVPPCDDASRGHQARDARETSPRRRRGAPERLREERRVQTRQGVVWRGNLVPPCVAGGPRLAQVPHLAVARGVHVPGGGTASHDSARLAPLRQRDEVRALRARAQRNRFLTPRAADKQLPRARAAPARTRPLAAPPPPSLDVPPYRHGRGGATRVPPRVSRKSPLAKLSKTPARRRGAAGAPAAFAARGSRLRALATAPTNARRPAHRRAPGEIASSRRRPTHSCQASEGRGARGKGARCERLPPAPLDPPWLSRPRSRSTRALRASSRGAPLHLRPRARCDSSRRLTPTVTEECSVGEATSPGTSSHRPSSIER